MAKSMGHFRQLLRLEEFIENSSPPSVSFEFFPPKTPAMEASLWETITQLASLSPRFVSVTYGAGGSTRERTHNTVKRILEETALKPAAHLTCVGATKEEINEIAQSYWESGVRHIVALRGDPPDGAPSYAPHPGGYPYCVDLIHGLKNIADFEISVAGFPEVHPEAPNPQADMEYLKKKIDAGASRVLTQYFFDADVFLRFRDNAIKNGINVPIVPGVLLISNFEQMINFSKRCGASVPKWVHSLLEGMDSCPVRRNHISTVIAAEMCRIMTYESVDALHFYTLNRADIAYSVCRILGIKEK